MDDLSKQYEIGRGKHGKIQGRDETGKFIEPKKDKLSSIGEEDVNEKTAKNVNVSAKTVQRARAYVKAVKENPEYNSENINILTSTIRTPAF